MKKSQGFLKAWLNPFRNDGDLAKPRCTTGILQAPRAINTGALSRHRTHARAEGTRVSQLSSPMRAEGLGGGLRKETRQMLSRFPASHHFPGRLSNFLLVKYLPHPSFFTTVGEKRRREKRRKIPKLSHHTFFSLSRFCSASRMAEGARAGCSMQFVFSP